MKKVAFFSKVLVIGFILSAVTPLIQRSVFLDPLVYAQDDWKKEFDDICSKTEEAMTLSQDEIKNLVVRCDRVKPLIEKLDETQRKIYLKRLRMCRDLFIFVLESKEKK